MALVSQRAYAKRRGISQDPNFLIPEVIDRIELYKGPYFPQFGDFATAGTVKLITKEEFEENFVKAEGGSFQTMRYVLGASPRLGDVTTLLAGQAFYTNGPFIHPENLARYNGEGRLTLDPTPDSKLSATVQGYAADWDASGPDSRAPGGDRPCSIDRGRRPGARRRSTQRVTSSAPGRPLALCLELPPAPAAVVGDDLAEHC